MGPGLRDWRNLHLHLTNALVLLPSRQFWDLGSSQDRQNVGKAGIMNP
jgi:hypothetical protein